MIRHAFLLAVAIATAAPCGAGLVLIDFGQAPQEDLSNNFDYSFGPATTTRSFDADNLIIDSTYGATFDVSGSGLGGDFTGMGSFIGDVLPAALVAGSPLQFEGSLERVRAGSTFDAEENLFDFKIVLLPVGGTGSVVEYSFIDDANDTSGVDPGAGNPPVTGLWTGSLLTAAPTPGFVVDQVQFILQAGDELGSRGEPAGITTLRVDNLQVVPEPATLAALALGLAAVATRRRNG